MIDLRNTYVVIRTQEEYENILKIAGKQGFHWYEEEDARPFVFTFSFPYILHFRSDYIIGVIRKDLKLNFIDYKCYEASELLGTKEMTAKEFAEWIADISKCGERKCAECVLNKMNTECSFSLCIPRNWKGNIDELLEIALLSRTTVLSPEEEAIDTIEKFIENPDRATLNDEFVESLKLVVEKLKEVK